MATPLHAGNFAVVVDPSCGGRIASLQVRGAEILVTSAESSLDWGMYPMVPFAGRLRDGQFTFDGTTYQLPTNSAPHALHGTVFDTPWNVESHSGTHVTLSTDLGPTWPFSAVVQHRIDLTPQRLRCELTVQAVTRMPIQLGWHPWFSLPQHVEFHCASMLRRDDDGITTTQRCDPAEPPVDDCFFEPNDWPRVVTNAHTVEIASDCPYWVRYDAPHGHVCIEPQSGPPNGLNTKPLVLDAGQQFSRWMEIRLVEST